MTEERKFAILFAATILAARKLSDPDLKPWPRTAIIRHAISSANQILEEIDTKCLLPYRKSPLRVRIRKGKLGIHSVKSS